MTYKDLFALFFITTLSFVTTFSFVTSLSFILTLSFITSLSLIISLAFITSLFFTFLSLIISFSFITFLSLITSFPFALICHGGSNQRLLGKVGSFGKFSLVTFGSSGLTGGCWGSLDRSNFSVFDSGQHHAVPTDRNLFFFEIYLTYDKFVKLKGQDMIRVPDLKSFRLRGRIKSHEFT